MIPTEKSRDKEIMRQAGSMQTQSAGEWVMLAPLSVIALVSCSVLQIGCDGSSSPKQGELKSALPKMASPGQTDTVKKAEPSLPKPESVKVDLGWLREVEKKRPQLSKAAYLSEWERFAQKDPVAALATWAVADDSILPMSRDIVATVLFQMSPDAQIEAWHGIKHEIPSERLSLLGVFMVQRRFEDDSVSGIKLWMTMDRDLTDHAQLSTAVGTSLSKLPYEETLQALNMMTTADKLDSSAVKHAAQGLGIQSLDSDGKAIMGYVDYAAANADKSPTMLTGLLSGIALGIGSIQDPEPILTHLVNNYPNDPRFSLSIENAFARWAKNNTGGVSQMLAKLPGSLSRDYAIAGLVQIMRDVNPEVASVWQGQIQDAAARRRSDEIIRK